MATIYHEQDTDPSALAGQKIAVLGFGSQGHAHAQNLKDSGYDVRVGPAARLVSRGRRPRRPGSACSTPPTRSREADVVMVLLPDTSHGEGLRGRHRAEPRAPATC